MMTMRINEVVMGEQKETAEFEVEIYLRQRAPVNLNMLVKILLWKYTLCE